MSIYRPDHNVLFIHIPKTAGTSMERKEFLGGGGHCPVWLLETVIPHIDQVFKFAFVRNPYARFLSAFFQYPPEILYHNEKDIEIFTMFVRKVGEMKLEPIRTYPKLVNWPLHHHFLPQWFFIVNHSERIAVDFVGRCENLKADWKKVCDKIGVSDEIGWLRKTGHNPYEYYYAPETKAIIRKKYKRDFELFNYQ